MRLDKGVLNKLPDINRSNVQKLIRSGLVKVNNRVVKLPGKKISASDELQVEPKESKTNLKLKLKVIYEDKDCIAVDKPAGVLTHSKGAELMEPTVASWLADYLGKKPKTNRDLIVHRLDRGTSGVIICAKHEKAQKLLQRQFSERLAKKRYTAIISGVPKDSEAIIDAPIERNPKKPSQFKVSENGKSATTRYKVIANFNINKKPACRVELGPKTGRTHQLRVHMKYIKHPILGDEFYGGAKADRLYLHASSLQLKLPGGQTKKLVSRLPRAFNDIKE
jgi:23S rRNA pseudouridine1911/1915/1917 synthase